jgi:hypothetical protein
MHGRDVFAVPELIDTKGGIYTVGGITKKNVAVLDDLHSQTRISHFSLLYRQRYICRL